MSNEAQTTDDNKPSAAEALKEASGYLRGTIGEQLRHAEVDHFDGDAASLLKFHGTYQQDDRDRRKELKKLGKDKEFSFMVRTKIPGGRFTSEQLLAELDLCDEIGNTTLRITTRQGLQLHGVLKSNLKECIARINAVQASTLGACGDVNRNVMCCPAPHEGDPVRTAMHALADELAAHFAPRTTAYHDLWLTDTSTGEKTLAGGGEEGHVLEPIYGKHYLPRKFKMAIGLPEDNCVDMYANDLAFMAIVEGGRVAGYNLIVGGGFGVTPSAKKTFPAVGQKMAYVPAADALAAAEAIVKVQRDFGNRSDRKRARMKYLIADWGLPAFKAKVEEYFGSPLAPPAPRDVTEMDDHIGWREQPNGRWYYGLNVENGRIRDDERHQIKAALREICRALQPGIRFTAHQSILFTDLAAEDKPRLEEILREHRVVLSEEISTVRRWSMACVAWPTCGLSITEAERALPGMIDDLERELARLGLADERFTVRMTGCPNGCARPYNSDVGLVGKTLGKYTLFLGGRVQGDRLNAIYKDLVPENEVVHELVPLLLYFKHERQPGETFGDFCHRQGTERLLAWADQYRQQAIAS